MIETSAVPALQLSGLVKRFDDKLAVAGIDLVVPPTSFYGLVGPNGAGKTTTLSMATGCCVPTRARRGCTASTSGPTRSRRRR